MISWSTGPVFTPFLAARRVRRIYAYMSYDVFPWNKVPFKGRVDTAPT